MSSGFPLLNLSSNTVLDGSVGSIGIAAGLVGTGATVEDGVSQQNFVTMVGQELQRLQSSEAAVSTGKQPVVSLSASLQLADAETDEAQNLSTSYHLLNSLVSVTTETAELDISLVANQLLAGTQENQLATQASIEGGDLLPTPDLMADSALTSAEVTAMTAMARPTDADTLPVEPPSLDVSVELTGELEALTLTQMDLAAIDQLGVDHVDNELDHEPVLVLPLVDTLEEQPQPLEQALASLVTEADTDMSATGELPVTALEQEVTATQWQTETGEFYSWGTVSLNTPIAADNIEGPPSEVMDGESLSTDLLVTEDQLAAVSASAVTAKTETSLSQVQETAIAQQLSSTNAVENAVDAEPMAVEEPVALATLAAASQNSVASQEGRTRTSRSLEAERGSSLAGGITNALQSAQASESEAPDSADVAQLGARYAAPTAKGALDTVDLNLADISNNGDELLGESSALEDSMASFDEVLEGIVSKNALKLLQSGTAAGSAINGLAALDNRPNVSNPLAQLAIPQSVTSASWGTEVTDKVLWMAAKGVTEAEIQLDPPELGPLQARVTVHQDQAQVVFTSHSAQVREALDQQATRLREMFAGEGLNLTDVDVSDQQAQDSRGQGQSQQESEQGAGLAGATASTSDNLVGQEATPVNMSQFLVDQYV